ncbi:MAG: hypothetical protein SX243_11675 [Acidobacteriota bacterium]|nr:hypothetical protein [Acidobacteriota bacterium]
MISELLIGIVSGILATAIGAQALRLKQFGQLRKIKIFEPESEQLNRNFYEYFKERINGAREEIIVTGEGFEFKGSDGPRIAKNYHEAMRGALARDVHITRFQTLRPLNPQWAELLGRLLEDFPDYFHLYIVDNKAQQDIASVCVIDQARRSNVVELMLSAERDLEDSKVRVASTGMFIHGRKDLARRMRKNVLAMKNYKSVKPVRTKDELDEVAESA